MVEDGANEIERLIQQAIEWRTQRAIERRKQRAEEGRPPDADDELRRMIDQIARPSHFSVGLTLPINWYYTAGAELNERWAGFRAELVYIAYEAGFRPRALIPDTLTFTVPSAADAADALHIKVRWRIWRVGIEGFLEGWYDYEQQRDRLSLRDFDPDGAQADVLAFISAVREHARPGPPRRWLSREALERDLEATIKKLQRDYYTKQAITRELVAERMVTGAVAFETLKDNLEHYQVSITAVKARVLLPQRR